MRVKFMEKQEFHCHIHSTGEYLIFGPEEEKEVSSGAGKELLESGKFKEVGSKKEVESVAESGNEAPESKPKKKKK